jgi:glycerophosphoryl diester phosphodiesterase
MNTNRFFQKKTRPFVLGHRGVPRLHQENSLGGIRRALELGLDGVEFDVFLTKDRRVVVFHDADTERLTGVPGKVVEMTWDELSKLRLQRRVDMGGGMTLEFEREEPIPLLEDVLAEFGSKLLMDIELKPEHPGWSERHVGAEVAKIVRAAGLEDSVVVSGFDPLKLRSAKGEHEKLHTCFAWDDDMFPQLESWLRWLPEVNTEIAAAKGNQNAQSFINGMLERNVIPSLIGCTALNIEHTLIDSDTIAKLHGKGRSVGSYTLFPLDTRMVRDPNLDQEAELARLTRDGVDWVETDDPERALNLLRARAPG